ncbi:MAG: inositol monophosphatase family protein, partial [Phycisphaerae bacterium]
MHLALVAAGAIDAVYCRRCYAWDIAAGSLLIAEAGGVCSQPDGAALSRLPRLDGPASVTPILAACANAHAQLLGILKRCESPA